MLKREIDRLRDLDRRVNDLLVPGLAVHVSQRDLRSLGPDAEPLHPAQTPVEPEDPPDGAYMVVVDVMFDGVAEQMVEAESGTAVEPGEWVWLGYRLGDLNSTPYVLGGLRPRWTHLALSTMGGFEPGAPLNFGAAASAWRKLGDVLLRGRQTTWLAVGRLRVDYVDATENKVHWSARLDVELAATDGGAPGSGAAVLGRTLSSHSPALDQSGGGAADVGLALRVERAEETHEMDRPDETQRAEIWCGVRHVAVAEAELVVRTGSETIGSGTFVSSVELQRRNIGPSPTAALMDLDLYEMG